MVLAPTRIFRAVRIRLVLQAFADVKPIAARMIGGVGASAVLELLLYSVIYVLWKKYRLADTEEKKPSAIPGLTNVTAIYDEAQSSKTDSPSCDDPDSPARDSRHRARCCACSLATADR
jgi:hypothetical protein